MKIRCRIAAVGVATPDGGPPLMPSIRPVTPLHSPG
jgi:hypothetical protein